MTFMVRSLFTDPATRLFTQRLVSLWTTCTTRCTFPCAVTPELRDTGRYGFLLPED